MKKPVRVYNDRCAKLQLAYLLSSTCILLSGTAAFAQSSEPATTSVSPTAQEGGTAPEAGSGADVQSSTTGSYARSGNDANTGEIVVTATGRGARSFDVPLSLSVTSGKELARANITDVANISAIDPAVTVRRYGPGVNSFIIRGIASQGQPTTGVYYDNAPLLGGYQTEGSGDSTPPLRLVDVERLEVLKGPQGTLFGQGSMAGTVRIITVKPDLSRFSGQVSVEGGSTSGGNPLYEGSLILNVPITPTIGIRAVAWAEEGGGFIDHQPYFSSKLYKNSNDEHLRGGRVSALWQPSDALDILIKYTRQTLNAPDSQVTSSGSRHYLNRTATFEPYRDRLSILDATATYQALAGEFSVAVARTKYLRDRRNDGTDAGILFTGSNAPLTSVGLAHYRGTTAELRYTSKWTGPLQLVAGVYYQRDSTPIEGTPIVADSFSGQVPCSHYSECVDLGLAGPEFNLPGNTRSSAIRRHWTRQQAYYAQGEYRLLTDVTLTAGVRYFRAKLEDDAQFLRTFAQVRAGTLGIGPVSDRTSTTQSKLTYNFSLAWEPVSTLNLYARVASGFRIGGLNDYQSAKDFYNITIPTAYSPDSLRNYEIGAKASLIDRRLLLDGSLFYIDWSRQQLPGVDSTGVVSYTINAGKTRVKGGELSIRSLPLDGLSLNVGITYVSSRLARDLPVEVASAGTPGISGDLIPNNPKWSGNVQAEYHFPAFDEREGYLGGTLTYKGKSFNRFESDPLRIAIPSATVIGLRAGVRSEQTDIGLYVNNVFNKFVISGVRQVVVGSGLPSAYFVERPRTISLRVTTHF